MGPPPIARMALLLLNTDKGQTSILGSSVNIRCEPFAHRGA